MSYLVMRLHSTHVDMSIHTMQDMGREPTKCDAGVGTGHTQSKCVVRINQVNSLRALHVCRENCYWKRIPRYVRTVFGTPIDVSMDTVVFQQDGAPPHFAITVRDYLNQVFSR